jgi:hypothetical protein
LCARADDDGQACRYQRLDAGHALFVSKQRPVTHRATIDDGTHAKVNEFLALGGKRIEVRLTA